MNGNKNKKGEIGIHNGLGSTNKVKNVDCVEKYVKMTLGDTKCVRYKENDEMLKVLSIGDELVFARKQPGN